MQAIKAILENGNIRWIEKPPTDNAAVTVLFPQKRTKIEKGISMSNKEALRILKKYSGSLDRDIDIEKERDEYLNEKYNPLN